MAEQISAIERLMLLGPLFTGREMTIRFGWTSKSASHYLYLWKKRGLIQPLGGHSDVFANLLVQRDPDWEAAVRLAMPSAVIVGLDVLRRAGWITQIPALPEVFVDSTAPRFSVPAFDIKPKPAAWFTASRPGVQNGLLHPSWALANMLKSEGWGDCGLQPDDIYWDAITDRDRREWANACSAYGIDPTALDAVSELMLSPQEFRSSGRTRMSG